MNHIVQTGIAAAAAATVTGASAQLVPRPVPEPVPVPPPAIVVKDAGPMEIRSLEVKADVRGIFSTVETTIVFHNPNQRVLEGELVFPLPDRAVVCGYALDVNGAMVDGVVVPKEEARIAFESEVRRGVDPGLVEQVKGNIYRTRVYPLPANGDRTVRLVYNAPLFVSGAGASLSIPMPREKIARRAVQIEVVAPDAAPPALAGLGDRRFERAETVWRVRSEEADVTPGDDILVALPAIPRSFTVMERDPDGRIWRAATAIDEPASGESVAAAAKKLAAAKEAVEVFWDASGSRAPSGAEFAALESLLALFSGDSAFRLRVFRDTCEPARDFASAAELVAAVKAIDAYDGGTRFDGVFDGVAADAVKLIFSDGLDTLSATPPARALGRAFAFTAGANADHAFLRRITGGNVLRLETGAKEICAAVALSLAKEGPDEGAQGVSGEKGGADDVVVAGAGWKTTLSRMQAGEAADDGAVPGRVIATAWAAARVAELSGDPDGNEDELLGLGRKYSIVGPKTSLLVLESLDQWLRYGIEPPATLPEMRRAWAEAMKNRGGDTPERSRESHRGMLLALWKERLAWWERDYTKDPLPVKPPAKSGRGGFMDRLFGGGVARSAAAPADGMAAPAAFFGDMSPGMPGEAMEGEAMEDASYVEANVVLAERIAPPGEGHEDVAGASIAVAAWDPATPYLKVLKDAKDDALYAAYIAERRAHADSPSFFLDCADHFFKRGKADLAIRILTNLAEMRLEDVALLRVYAWRLRQAGAYGDAIPQLRRIARLRPEDGQSLRDLALNLSERGKRRAAAGDQAGAKADLDEAFELYAKTAFTPWRRHADVLGIFALEEFNALASWVAENMGDAGIAIPEVGEEFSKRISTDVRIMMEWDADNTDIDLHVVEPNGEEAFYAHNRTMRGGLVSRDVTDGFGPEEYMIRRAPKGEYEVFAHYFGSHQQTLLGPATVTATVFTNWGRKGEESRTMSLRLDKTGDKIPVGSIVFTPGK